MEKRETEKGKKEKGEKSYIGQPQGGNNGTTAAKARGEKGAENELLSLIDFGMRTKLWPWESPPFICKYDKKDINLSLKAGRSSINI